MVKCLVVLQYLDKQQQHCHLDDILCDNLSPNQNQTNGVHPYGPRRGRFHCTNLTAVPNDYSEPIFDNTSTPAALNVSDYSYPQDAIVPHAPATDPSPYCTPVTEHSYVNFVQPADSLVLLLNQIKQTNVKEISRSTIK